MQYGEYCENIIDACRDFSDVLCLNGGACKNVDGEAQCECETGSANTTTYLPPANVVCEGYVFTGVCLSTGGCLPQCMLGCHTPPKQTPLSRHPSPEGRHPSPEGRHPREQTPPPRSRQPPLEADTPLGSRPPSPTKHAGRYGQRAGGTHPSGMQSCLTLEST